MHLGCVYINYTYLGGNVEVYDSETAHGCSAHRTQQSVVNGIFVHLLHICSTKSRTRTVHLGCVYINYTYPGGTVVHFTRRVRPIPHTAVHHRAKLSAMNGIFYMLYGSIPQCTYAVCK